jgi:CheY-like chemotaxis protein
VNLVINARDAMPKGGLVTITAENVCLKKADTLEQIEGDYVALRVTDTGNGIAPDVLPRVFDPFFTTKGVNKGSGLGLSQVHGFAHQSGGTVTIRSELGKGTQVTLYLARSDEAARRAAGEPGAQTVGGKVLVVEDNPDVLDLDVTMLRQLGYETQTAVDSATALDAVEKGDFDLVVTDVVMPGGMDGLALARAIRARRPDLPVLLVTGYNRAVAQAGAEFAVMRKPFQMSDLSRVASRLIAESKQPPSSNLVRLNTARRAAAEKRDP